MTDLLLNVERFGMPIDGGEAASATVSEAGIDGVSVTHRDGW